MSVTKPLMNGGHSSINGGHTSINGGHTSIYDGHTSINGGRTNINDKHNNMNDVGVNDGFYQSENKRIITHNHTSCCKCSLLKKISDGIVSGLETAFYR